MEEDKIVKGYKGFDKDFKCRGFQYEEGKEYETDDAVICEKGFHLCTNPLDVLNYYNLCDSEFAEVEAHGKTVDAVLTISSLRYNDGDSKVATTKIKIGAKLSLSDFIKASINFLLEKCKKEKKSGDYSQLASSGDYSQLASSGDYSQLASSGYYSKLASSGDYSKLASSGHYSKLASSGDSSKLASSGDGSKLASSGHYSKLASSGYGSKLASSGDSSQLASSGDSSRLASSGHSSRLASSGYGSKLASSGDSSQLASSGDSSRLASSGDYSQLEIMGIDSIGAGIGINNRIKAVKSSWITLAEWEYDKNKGRYIPICVKSTKVDGKKIKEDVFYKLENGKFVEDK